MSIREIYQAQRCVLSLEVFPPKKQSAIDSIFDTLKSISSQKPDFVSVTYGAGGSAQAAQQAIDIASMLQNQWQVTALSHLTCIGATRKSIGDIAQKMRQENIQNILSLRGDPPETGCAASDYHYAYELIRDMKEQGCFDVGAACYPEGHIASSDEGENFAHMKTKEEAGADFFISQLFFDNDTFYRFLDGARAAGVTAPISAGVMPILSRGQIERMIFMCGASLPARIVKLLHRYQDQPDELRKAGIDYATAQAADLMAHGVDGVHIYTMNQPDIAKTILTSLRHAQ